MDGWEWVVELPLHQNAIIDCLATWRQTVVTGKLSQRLKYGLAIAGQIAIAIFIAIAGAAIFKLSLFGQDTFVVAIACWALAGTTFFLKCEGCRRSYFFDPERYRGGFSIVPGYNGFKKLGPTCRNCGLSRIA